MPDTADLALRIARLERRVRIAVVAAAVGSALGIVAIFGAAGSRVVAATAAGTGSPIVDVLRVRELNVVDRNGVTRVKIGSPLPTAVVDGRRNRTRGGSPEDTMSGMLLFDAEGMERSGYATVDHGYSNVLLTLDDKHRQHAMFIAEPTGATTLRLFNADTKDRVDVAIDQDGPSISMIRRGKEIYRFRPGNNSRRRPASPAAAARIATKWAVKCRRRGGAKLTKFTRNASLSDPFTLGARTSRRASAAGDG